MAGVTLGLSYTVLQENLGVFRNKATSLQNLVPNFELSRFFWFFFRKGTSTVASKVAILWSPYGIGQTIYIFMLWFVLSFFPRLISAAADCMSAILPHMVWP